MKQKHLKFFEKMKKTILLSLFAAFLLASCGQTKSGADTQAVAADSVVVDTVTVAELPADTVVAVVDSVAK